MPRLRQQRLVYRAAQLQSDDAHFDWADGRHVVGGVPAPGDRARHLRELQKHLPKRAQAAAVRRCADRKIVPQRDHAGKLHLSGSRVRTGGAGIFRSRRRRRHGDLSCVGRAPQELVRELRYRFRAAAFLRADRIGASTLCQGRHRRRVSLSVGLGRARVDRASRYLRPRRAHARSPAKTCASSTKRPRRITRRC